MTNSSIISVTIATKTFTGQPLGTALPAKLRLDSRDPVHTFPLLFSSPSAFRRGGRALYLDARRKHRTVWSPSHEAHRFCRRRPRARRLLR